MREYTTHHDDCGCLSEKHLATIRELVEIMERALNCWRAANNSTELWEAWADNLGEEFQNEIAKSEKLLSEEK